MMPLQRTILMTFRPTKFYTAPIRTFKKQINTSKGRTKKVNLRKHKEIKSVDAINQVEQNQFSSPFAVTVKYGLYSISLTAVVFGTGAIMQYIHQSDISLNHAEYWNKLEDKFKNEKEIEFRQTINEVWNHLPRFAKYSLGIIGCNASIFLCWKLLPTMVMSRWFSLSALKSQSAYVTILTSNYSHKHFLHFFINMYVFISFSKAWNARSLFSDPECRSPERFVSFYTMAGVYGCYLSLIVKTLSKNSIPSLGASAAILGLIGYVCEKKPNSMLSIVFLPNWQFSAGSAKNFIIAFDVCGLLLGAITKWRYYILDHAGHLGGMLFGLWYAKTGEVKLNKFCKKVMTAYRSKEN